ncbi:MAG TPA: bifunctional phosphoribosylaminoimidazolecarboxamide formyltransferase/IMP cyclohydrolase, partial [Pyrinomonadaceae bacterium]
MSEQNPKGLRSIRRALLSVSDKTGLVEFARALRRFEVELLSTGGTAQALREAGIEVRDVSEVTGFPEMLDGRVKTLHPRIHGGLLAVRDNDEHVRALNEHGIEPVDMAVVNLYPFEQTIARAGTTLAEAVEQIDIGGPAMVRSAAKNYADVAVVTSPELYESILLELAETGGALSWDTRARLALQAFERTSAYDRTIADYLGARQAERDFDETIAHTVAQATTVYDVERPEPGGMPDILELSLGKMAELRYGENPHQTAALYAMTDAGIASAQVLAGKEMSFNNYIDAEAAWQLVNDFAETACAIIKHTNPAGCALGAIPEEAYRRALQTDPVSAFGGIVAFNRKVDERAARAVIEIFTEVVVAPGYDEQALEVLRSKKNLRVLSVGREGDDGLLMPDYDYKKISGG